MKINYETVHFNYADRIGNLTAEAVGVVKGEKHFPVYSGNRIFKPLSKSKPFYAFVRLCGSVLVECDK